MKKFPKEYLSSNTSGKAVISFDRIYNYYFEVLSRYQLKEPVIEKRRWSTSKGPHDFIEWFSENNRSSFDVYKWFAKNSVLISLADPNDREVIRAWVYVNYKDMRDL